jgi:hypothetical protein
VHDAWLVYVAVGALVVLVCGLLAGALARGRLGAAAAVLGALAVALWALDLAAISSGYRDADGFVDCAEECTAVHFTTAIGFLGAPLLVSVSALAAVVALVRHRRRSL